MAFKWRQQWRGPLKWLKADEKKLNLDLCADQLAHKLNVELVAEHEVAHESIKLAQAAWLMAHGSWLKDQGSCAAGRRIAGLRTLVLSSILNERAIGLLNEICEVSYENMIRRNANQAGLSDIASADRSRVLCVCVCVASHIWHLNEF